MALRRAAHEIQEGNTATMETCDLLKEAKKLAPSNMDLQAAHTQLLLKVADQEQAKAIDKASLSTLGGAS